MITEKFLLALGFERLGEAYLPAWYNIFEGDPETKTSPAFSFPLNSDDTYLKVYLSPKGIIGEVYQSEGMDNGFTYTRIAAPEDIIDLIEYTFTCELNWEPLPF